MCGLNALYSLQSYTSDGNFEFEKNCTAQPDEQTRDNVVGFPLDSNSNGYLVNIFVGWIPTVLGIGWDPTVMGISSSCRLDSNGNEYIVLSAGVQR